MGDNEPAGEKQGPFTPASRQPGPLPNWTAIFTVHDRLTPPGFAEVFIDIHENPYVKPKEADKEKTAAKKKKKKLGRNEKA
jgi:hypothetical protein